MEGFRTPDGHIVVTMLEAEAVVLHELIAFAEFSNDLEAIRLPRPVDRKVASDVQQALAPVVPDLGTDRYSQRLERAYAEIDATPY